MAQNFWTAIFAFSVCFVVTIAVSLVTKPRDEKDLVGLVYSLTPKQTDDGEAWYARPAVLGSCVLAGALVLNIVFW
jgi:SSS family solute:Na+ symporter